MYVASWSLLKQISFILLHGTAYVLLPALMLRFISHETVSKVDLIGKRPSYYVQTSAQGFHFWSSFVLLVSKDILNMDGTFKSSTVKFVVLDVVCGTQWLFSMWWVVMSRWVNCNTRIEMWLTIQKPIYIENFASPLGSNISLLSCFWEVFGQFHR